MSENPLGMSDAEIAEIKDRLFLEWVERDTQRPTLLDRLAPIWQAQQTANDLIIKEIAALMGLEKH